MQIYPMESSLLEAMETTTEMATLMVVMAMDLVTTINPVATTMVMDHFGQMAGTTLEE